jgi:hypothetical protein
MVGSNNFALARAASLIEGAGLRVADTVTVSAAQERLGRQAAASAIWIELDGQFDAAAEQLLDEVNRDVAAGHYAAVVSTTSALIDPVVARLNERSIELIVDADDRQRAAAPIRHCRRQECGPAETIKRGSEPDRFNAG